MNIKNLMVQMAPKVMIMNNKETQAKIKASVMAGAQLYKRYLELDTKASNIRAQIAKLAVETCDVRRGGNYEGVYTLKQFAKDIGMSSTTLCEWTLIYKAGLKINLTEPNEEEWAQLRQALAVEKHENSKYAQKLGIKKDRGDSSRDVIRDIIGKGKKKGKLKYKFSLSNKNSNFSITSSNDDLKINIRRFMRTLDNQQKNLSEYQKGDLGVNNLELLKNYLVRMKKKVDSLVRDGE